MLATLEAARSSTSTPSLNSNDLDNTSAVRLTGDIFNSHSTELGAHDTLSPPLTTLNSPQTKRMSQPTLQNPQPTPSSIQSGAQSSIRSASMPNNFSYNTHRYTRTKPLYEPLSKDQFRLLRIVPGTRRGEYTTQIFETSISTAAEEYGYSILTLAPQPQSQQPQTITAHASPARTLKPNGYYWATRWEQELTYFPILSLGGGEHQIEVEWGVKRALEGVVEERWDCFHARTDGEQSKSNRDKLRESRQILDSLAVKMGTGHDEQGERPETMLEENEDGESDAGDGEDFYLWIKDICVDQTDVSDQRQQDILFCSICEGAKEIILATVPHEIRGKVEIKRLENLGSAKNLNELMYVDAVRETFCEMRLKKEIEEGRFQVEKDGDVEREIQRRAAVPRVRQYGLSSWELLA